MSISAFFQSLRRKNRVADEIQPTTDHLHTQNTQADSRPWTYDPRHSLYLTKGYTMKLRAGTKKVTLVRFLLAKMVYGKEGEGLSLEEFLVFHEIAFALLESKDPNLIGKWELSLSRISQLIPVMAEIKEFPVVLSAESRSHLVDFFKDDPILPNPEAYFGLMGNRDLRNSFRIQFRSQWIPPKRVERYIGVGYKDKGTRRVPELDGSPSWQDVAREFANREREQEEAELAYAAPPAE